MFLKKNSSSTPIIIIIITLITDEVSKLLISLFFDEHSHSKDIFFDYLRFTYITNDGIAFGFNPFKQQIFLFILSIFAVFFVIKILLNSSDTPYLSQIGLSLIIGGALGNLVDRFFTTFNIMGYTGVIDFIDIGINHYRFYIFNFADSFITIGIILYIYSFIRLKMDNER